MFNKSSIKRAAAIAAVILAATALPVNITKADIQTISNNEGQTDYIQIRTASELVEASSNTTGKLSTSCHKIPNKFSPLS